ncbi:MAG: hypothetical protein IH831_05095 [Planctomycetes bacterium]|nr:hypothetical protein [Planctomycetota bacterium]
MKQLQCVVTLSIVFVTAGVVQAVPLLDQDNLLLPTTDGIGTLAVAEDVESAQTFRVGMTGTLTTVLISLYRGFDTVEDLRFDIRPTTAEGIPFESQVSALVTRTVSPATIVAADLPSISSLEDYTIVVDISAANIHVSAGDMLAIVLHSDAQNMPPYDERYDWFRNEPESYENGSAYQKTNGAWTPVSNDLLFRTYVDAGPGPPYSANFDFDGSVNGKDFLIWQMGFGSGTTFVEGDANGDGTVDAADLAIWELQYGTVAPLSAAAAVPEPTTCTLALAALCLAMSRRRAF